LASLVFLVFAVGSSAFWLRIYSKLDRIAAGRREELMRTVARPA
jgi:hypothetical protein